MQGSDVRGGQIRPRGNVVDFQLRRGETVAPIWQI
jgi:hypothetical protein